MTNKQPPPPAREGTMGEPIKVLACGAISDGGDECIRATGHTGAHQRRPCDGTCDTCECDFHDYAEDVEEAVDEPIPGPAWGDEYDIVSRLRRMSEQVNAGHDRYIPNLADDAADEITRLRAERDALLAALHEQGCPSWGRQRNGVYSGCGKCVACRADDIVMNATPTPALIFGHDGTTGGNDDPNG